jgi:hemerythrin-like domain-containing protein
MCEYCGCQAVAAIEELTREHDHALDHVRAAEQAARAADLDAARVACRRLERLLGPHTAVEEQALLPALAREFPDQVADLVEEHRRVESALEALGSPFAPQTWRADLVEAMGVLRHHILVEQDGVFPAALATLSVADWEAVDEVRATVGPGLATGASR